MATDYNRIIQTAYNTRVQALILEIKGQEPTMPPEGLTPRSEFWKETDLMPAEWALNIADDRWFYNNGVEIKALPINQQGEAITPSNTALFEPTKDEDENGFAYLAGKDFVVYSNLASSAEAFWEQDIYLCVANAEPG